MGKLGIVLGGGGVVGVAWEVGALAALAEAGVDLRRAVASSCAVPGMLPAVAVDPANPEERYVDGGLWSGTNADLLVDAGCSAAVVIEPMSGVDLPLARFSQRTLASEVAALRATGTPVEVVSPGSGYAALSLHLMDPAKRRDGLALGRTDGSAATDRLRDLVATATTAA